MFLKTKAKYEMVTIPWHHTIFCSNAMQAVCSICLLQCIIAVTHNTIAYIIFKFILICEFLFASEVGKLFIRIPLLASFYFSQNIHCAVKYYLL